MTGKNQLQKLVGFSVYDEDYFNAKYLQYLPSKDTLRFSLMFSLILLFKFFSICQFSTDDETETLRITRLREMYKNAWNKAFFSDWHQ